MRNFFLILVAVLLSAAGLRAQTEWGLASQPRLWQANRINPAFWPEQKVFISLPGIQNTLYFTGPTYGDIIREENGQNVLDVDALIASLEPSNLVREHLEIGTLGFGLRLGKNWGVSFQHTAHFNAWLSYPRALPQLVWQGNAPFIGETLFLDHDLQLYAYNEYAVGAFFESGALQLGGRVKYLAGIGDVSTSRGRASLYTDTAFYQLQFQADYELNTSSYFNYESYNDLALDFDFGQIKTSRLFTANPGLAFDLGIRLNMDRWYLSLSAIDLGGAINWREDVRNYRASGEYRFDGLDISQALTGDSVNFEGALDTLRALFSFPPTSNDYRTELPAKVYIGGGVKLGEKWQAGGLLFSEWYRGEIFAGMSVNANYSPIKWLSLGGSYAIFRKNFANIGLSAAARLGPVQIYALADNAAALFRPASSRYFHGRAGLNLVF